MRKILLSLLCLIVLSCSSDDDSNNEVILPPIVGTWVISEFNLVNDAFDLNEDGIESNEIISESGCYQGEKIIFNLDGTASITYTTDLGLVIINSNNVESFSYMCEEDNAVFNFTWAQLDNGSFVTNFGGEQTEFTLLTNNTMSKPSVFEYIFELNNSTTISSSDATTVYIKQ